MKNLSFIILLPFLFIGCKNDTVVDTSEPTKMDTVTIKETQKPTTNSDSVGSKDEIDEEFTQKATVNKNDSTIWIQVNMRLDHRIFGYEKPDVKSKKMILYSIFTDDVEGNPFQCPYGAYYDTTRYQDMILKFQENIGDFAKVKIITDEAQHTVYFEKKWLEFE